ncbi:hypothetical protein DFH08DRAFT_1020946 [Mycena albidolilacea]|uniref:Uncharacterized protein n=1 Tax=Mycena albidolilacea TaxID=1033008 RepID=A0AAD6ZPR4_9AGAR|nr:hypothetical protein DFH08DRAFT_1020946 [Mycena albidolilacea]
MNNYRSPVPLAFGQLASAMDLPDLGVPRVSTALASLSTSIPQEFVEAIMEDVDTRSLLISGSAQSIKLRMNRVARAATGTARPRRRRRDRVARTKHSAEVEGGRSARELPGEEAQQERRWRQKERNRQRIGRPQTRGAKRVYNGSGASADAVAARTQRRDLKAWLHHKWYQRLSLHMKSVQAVMWISYTVAVGGEEGTAYLADYKKARNTRTRFNACGDSDADSMRFESPPDCCVCVDIVRQGRFSGGRRDRVIQLRNSVCEKVDRHTKGRAEQR